MYIHLVKINSFVYRKENLALGKPVWEDQPWESPQDWRGDKAVDGRYSDRSAAGGQCDIKELRTDSDLEGGPGGRGQHQSHRYLLQDGQQPT